MANLAIKGHATRGEEVIEILEMLGGKNNVGLLAKNETLVYFIKNGVINNTCMNLQTLPFKTFTLEEFLEKFPYKVGDKVSSKYLKNYKIEKMEWEDTNNRVIYKLQERGWYSPHELQPYKEATMEEKLEQIIVNIPDGYEFFGINDDNKVVLTKKKPQYPKTYEECYKTLNIPVNGDIVYAGNWSYGGEYLDKHLDVIRSFQKLKLCRDAYWKIAGKEMGLGKPWEQDYDDRCFIICNDSGIIHTYDYYGSDNFINFILAFPTSEMRDTFYENFKDLIEACKELL